MNKIVVPVSGGKDSVSCLLLALEQSEREVIPVFYETGWDHPILYDYLRYLETTLGVKIQKTVFEEAPSLPELIRKYKRFPFGNGRFCTSTYKNTAFLRWLKTVEGNIEIWLGIRENESVNRQKKYGHLVDETVYETDEIFPGLYPNYLKSRVKLKFPILYWEAWNCFDFLDKKSIQRNPLYDQGFERVGCFPCMLAGRKTQEKVFRTEFGKKQFQIIRELEKELGEAYCYPTDEEAEGGCLLCSI